MGNIGSKAGLTLTALLIAACARSGVQTANAQLEPQAEADQAAADAGSIVVTGSSISIRSGRSRKANESYAMSPPPPPPPAPMMSTPGMGWAPPYHDQGRDKFTSVAQNAFKVVREEPVSTFSIDVDTASYSWVRASLNRNVMPQPAAVRTEEMVNYFSYDYARPASTAEPFRSNVTVMPSPWSPGRKLVRIGIKIGRAHV